MAVHSDHHIHRDRNILTDLWNSFWNPPELTCPKCGCKDTEYYDPFFFAPIRAFKNKRRIKCCSCGFIWRPSRKNQSFWDRYKRNYLP